MAVYDDEGAEARKRKKRQRERIDLFEENKRKAVEVLFASREGRDYLWWLLRVGKALGVSPFRGEPSLTAFACGEMNTGQKIMAHLVQTNPIAFADMMKENYEEARLLKERDRVGQNDLFDEDEESANTPSEGVEAPLYT